MTQAPGEGRRAAATAGLRGLVLVWLAGAAVLALALAGAAALGVSPLTLTRDPTAVMDVPFYTGALSNLGVLLWTAATSVCLFTFAVLPPAGPSGETRRFFLASGLLSALLLFDDLFLLHESFFPYHLGVPEKGVLLVYALLALLYVIRFRALFLRSNYVVFLLAGAWFALSVGIDAVSEQGLTMLVAEDVTKLFGIASWTTFLTQRALATLRPAPHAG